MKYVIGLTSLIEHGHKRLFTYEGCNMKACECITDMPLFNSQPRHVFEFHSYHID